MDFEAFKLAFGLHLFLYVALSAFAVVRRALTSASS